MQVVNLFLISLLVIETSANNFENVAWIKSDIYDWWYHMLDIFGSLLFIEIAKILVNWEVATTVA